MVMIEFEKAFDWIELSFIDKMLDFFNLDNSTQNSQCNKNVVILVVFHSLCNLPETIDLL